MQRLINALNLNYNWYTLTPTSVCTTFTFYLKFCSNQKLSVLKTTSNFFQFQKFSKVPPSFSSRNCPLTLIHSNFREIRQWAAFLPERTFESYNLSWLTSNIQFCIENDIFLTMIVTRLHFIQLFSFFSLPSSICINAFFG